MIVQEPVQVKLIEFEKKLPLTCDFLFKCIHTYWYWHKKLKSFTHIFIIQWIIDFEFYILFYNILLILCSHNIYQVITVPIHFILNIFFCKDSVFRVVCFYKMDINKWEYDYKWVKTSRIFMNFLYFAFKLINFYEY